MKHALIVLAIGGFLTGRGHAADGPMLPDSPPVVESATVPTLPEAGFAVPHGVAQADPAAYCDAPEHRGCLRKIGAWLTYSPLRTKDRHACCRAKPLIYLPPLYYFFLDRCSYGACGCGNPVVAGTMPVAMQGAETQTLTTVP